MSYEIVYKLEALRIPKLLTAQYDDTYILAGLIGSNNCWEVDNKRRHRDWIVLAVGSDCDIISRVCGLAGACERGGLTMSGRQTTPEGLIRSCRNALKHAAVGFQEAATRRMNYILRIRFPDKSRDERAERAYQELLEVRVPHESTEYGTTYKSFHFNTQSPLELALWARHLRYGLGSENAEVNGPTDTVSLRQMARAAGSRLRATV